MPLIDEENNLLDVELMSEVAINFHEITAYRG